MEGQEPPPSPSPCTQPSPSPYRNSSTLLKDISEFKTPKRVFPKKLPKPSMEGQEPPPSPSPCTQPSPSPYRNLSTLLKDISEVETPKRPSRISDFYSTCPDFLSSKHYPGSSSSFHRRPSLAPSNYGRTKAAARELNVFKLEHSQWSRKAQIKEGRSLKSLSVWLKFLFQNPTSCGCSLSVDGDRIVTQHTRKRDYDSSWPADAAVHKRYCRGWLIRSCLSCQRRATTTIKSAIPHRQAEVEFQWIVRGQNSRNRLLGASSLLPVVCNGCPLNSTGSLYMVVQRYIRGWLARLRYIHGVALEDKSCNLCQENVVRDLQVRAENTEKSNYEGGSIVTHDISAPDLVKAAIVVQRYIRGWLVRLRYIHGVAIVDKSCNLCQESVERDLQVRAAVKIQLAWKNFSVCRSLLYQLSAATKIQSHFRGWLLRRSGTAVRASHKGGLGGGARAGDGALLGALGAGKGTGRIRPNKGGGGAGGGGSGAGGAGVVKRITKARRPYRRVPLCRRDTLNDTERQLLMMRLWRYRSSGDIVNEVRAGLGGCRATDKVMFKVNNLQEISAAQVEVNGGIAYLDSHLVSVVAVCQLYGKLSIECFWMVGRGSGRRQKHEIHRETCQTMDRLMDHIRYITRFVCQFDGKIDLSFTMTDDGPDGEPLKLEGFQTHVENSDSWAGAFRGVSSIDAKFSSTAAEDGNGDVPPA